MHVTLHANFCVPYRTEMFEADVTFWFFLGIMQEVVKKGAWSCVQTVFDLL